MKKHLSKIELKSLKNLKIDEFFDFCREIEYGWRDSEIGEICDSPNYSKYGVQSPLETVKNQAGICWDQTELQRFWFEQNGYRVKTFLLYYYVNDNYCPSHSALVYQEGRNWCWFEPMFHETKVKYCGIHRYPNLDSFKEDLIKKFGEVAIAEQMLPEELEPRNWNLYEYTQPRYGMRDAEFYEHCRKGKRVL